MSMWIYIGIGMMFIWAVIGGMYFSHKVDEPESAEHPIRLIITGGPAVWAVALGAFLNYKLEKRRKRNGRKRTNERKT